MHNNCGFTLIELMIIVAIIAFLSMLSVPSLLRVLAKAKRAEAYLYLHTLAQAQKAYHAEHGSYTKKIGKKGSDSLQWEPEGNYNYTYGFPEGAEGDGHFTGQLNTPPSLLSGATISKNGFILYAAGYIYGDKPDIISIDHHHVIRIVNDALG